MKTEELVQRELAALPLRGFDRVNPNAQSREEQARQQDQLVDILCCNGGCDPYRDCNFGCVGSSFTDCDVIFLVLAVVVCSAGIILGKPSVSAGAAFLFFGRVRHRICCQHRPVAMVVMQALQVQQQQQQVSITMAAPPTMQLPQHDLMTQERVLMTQQQLMVERERELRDAER